MAKGWPVKERGLNMPELQFNTYDGRGRIIAPDGTKGHWGCYEHPMVVTDKRGDQFISFTEYYEGELHAYTVHQLVPVASKQTHKNYKKSTREVFKSETV